LSLLCIVIGLAEARRPSNCGLSCFRWKKCMGVVNGGNNRPGQLGDTGIIVLQECGPLKKKGCDCEEKEEEEKTEKPKQVTPTPSRSSGFSPVRSRFRNNRRGSAPRVSETTTATATTSQRSLRSSLFSNRSRIYRSKRLIAGRF